MGEVTNKEQDDRDAQELRTIAELCPAYRRYCSHHFRNSLSAIVSATALAIEKCDDPASNGELMNNLFRIKAATEHLLSDMGRAGI